MDQNTASGAKNSVRNPQPGIHTAPLSALAWAALAVVAAAAIAYFRTRHDAEAAAFFGFDPSGLLHPVWRLPQFAKNFPNGEEEALKSLIGQLYTMIGLLQLPDKLSVAAMIFMEAIVLMVGAYICTRTVNPRVPSWQAIGTAILLASGTVVSCDLARWFHPFYGSVYNFADGFGFAAFAYILKRRAISSGILLGVAATIHPIIALFFGIAVGLVTLLRFKEFRLGNLISAAVLALAIAGTWWIFMLRNAEFSSSDVNPHLYIGITRLTSVHWFPVSLGVFGSRSWETFLPFLGFMVLFASTLHLNGDRGAKGDAEIGAAVAVLVLLSILGALLSEYSNSPLLVKLALHRASAVALLLSATIVIPRLFQALECTSILCSGLAALLLLMPYWRDHGLPVMACLLFASLMLLRRSEHGGTVWAAIALAMIVLCAAITFALFAFGWTSGVFIPNVSGIDMMRHPLFIAAAGLMLLSGLIKKPVMGALAVALGIGIWAPSVDPIQDPSTLKQAQAYLHVEQWARTNTNPKALFMTPPTHAYGWRQFSERPSFGTLREWLYSGWIYNTSRTVFNEGLQRAEELGLRIPDLLIAAKRNQDLAYAHMLASASQTYNTGDMQWYADMARRNGIRYFVLDKRELKSRPPAADIAFENSRYLVIEMPDHL